MVFSSRFVRSFSCLLFWWTVLNSSPLYTYRYNFPVIQFRSILLFFIISLASLVNYFIPSSPMDLISGLFTLLMASSFVIIYVSSICPISIVLYLNMSVVQSIFSIFPLFLTLLLLYFHCYLLCLSCCIASSVSLFSLFHQIILGFLCHFPSRHCRCFVLFYSFLHFFSSLLVFFIIR